MTVGPVGISWLGLGGEFGKYRFRREFREFRGFRESGLDLEAEFSSCVVVVFSGRDEIGMARGKALYEDGQGLLEMRLGVLVTALLGVGRAQSGERFGDLRMVGAGASIPNPKGVFVEPLGLPVVACGLMEFGQVVDEHRRVGVMGSPGLDGNGQDALRERDGLLVAALAVQDHVASVIIAQLVGLGRPRPQKNQ